MQSSTRPIETVTLHNVLAARERIRGIALRTPLRPSIALGRDTGRAVGLKMEIMQATGAFKLRGAANCILALDPVRRRSGIVAASSGNHGRAVAYVAQKLGIPSTICVSKLVPPAKVAAVASLGAEVIVTGPDQDAAIAAAREIATAQGRVYICPFDDPYVIAGQGTIALEILEDWPDVETVVVQVSGGGLAAGVAMVLKTINPGIRVTGVTMERGAAMYHSLRAGKPVHVDEVATLADGLQGGVLAENRHTFGMCQRYLDEIMLVSEDQIADAIRYAFTNEHLILEGAGACGIALLRDERAAQLGQRAVAICTGDNIDPGKLLEIVGGD